MKLQPNIGSDRSWVWKVVADYSETPPTSETLAIRFANTERLSFCLFMLPIADLCSDAGQFKEKFEEAQKINTGTAPSAETSGKSDDKESDKKEEKKDDTKKDD